MKSKPDKEILDAMQKNPGNWKGIFYFNPKDPRLLVPKMHPWMGWTLNFASPYPYLFMLVLILLSIALGFSGRDF